VHMPPGRPEGISRVVGGDECDARRRRQEGQYVGGRPSKGADDPPIRRPGGPSLEETPHRPVQACALALYRLRTSAFPQPGQPFMDHMI
jgi:hypothetical protein